MAKKKVSVTLSPERLERAQELNPGLNVSEVVDEALDALVERELEKRWLDAHERSAGARDDDLSQEFSVNLAHLPWDESDQPPPR